MKKLNVLVLIAVCVFLLAGCGQKADDRGAFSELGEYVLERVMKNYEDGDINQEDIVIDRIYYGHFSQEDVNEILVLCKILNTPHVAGFDKTVAVLLEAASLKQVAYKEFNADNVSIDCVQTSTGQSKIVFIGTTTYQNISTQEIQLWGIQGNQWVDMPIESLENLSDDYFCFMGDGAIIVSSTDEMTDPADVIAILNWNPETEQFILN